MLLDSIRTQLDSLSKSERKVALAVLDHPGQTVSQNITALAKSAQVSEPTVVRFCRTLGYDGWHEFKLKLAQGLALALPGLNEQPTQDDLAADLVNKICSRSINTLLDLRNNLDPDAIQKALDILSKANKIEFYGQGSPASLPPTPSTSSSARACPRWPTPTRISTALPLPCCAPATPWWPFRSAATARRWCARSSWRAAAARRDRAGAIGHAAGRPGHGADSHRPDFQHRSLYAHLGPAGLPGGDRCARCRTGLATGSRFPQKMQNAQKALQEFDLQFDSFIS